MLIFWSIEVLKSKFKFHNSNEYKNRLTWRLKLKIEIPLHVYWISNNSLQINFLWYIVFSWLAILGNRMTCTLTCESISLLWNMSMLARETTIFVGAPKCRTIEWRFFNYNILNLSFTLKVFLNLELFWNHRKSN